MPTESVGIARSSLNPRLIACKASGLSQLDAYRDERQRAPGTICWGLDRLMIMLSSRQGLDRVKASHCLVSPFSNTLLSDCVCSRKVIAMNCARPPPTALTVKLPAPTERSRWGLPHPPISREPLPQFRHPHQPVQSLRAVYGTDALNP